MNRQQRRAEAKRASTKMKMPHRTGAAAPTLFDNAINYHRAGQLADAERLYTQILTTNPRHADALHLLGVIACQTGQPGLAAENISNAIRIDGSNAAYYSNLSNALRQLGRFDDAAEACRKAIKLKPNFAEAHSNLGAALYEAGHVDEAVIECRHAIDHDPNLPAAYTNLGNALARLGQDEEAAEAFGIAIRINPNLPEAHSNLGAVLDKLWRFEEAIDAYNIAIRLKPDDAIAFSNLGNALRELDRFDESVSACTTAVHLRPDYAEAHSNLGNAMEALGRFDEALAAYRKAIDLKPDYAEAHGNLAVVLEKLYRFDEALDACNTAISLKPDDSEFHFNLGNAVEGLGRFDEALTAYDTAIELKPDYAEAHGNRGNAMEGLSRYDEALTSYNTAISLKPQDAGFHLNLACALLKIGSYPEGWEKFEWRWKSKQLSIHQRNFEQPLWNGEAAEGKTLLIHAEQGYGDTLQFCRYVPLVAERGIRVVLEVQKPLVRLLRCLPGVDEVIGHGDALPAFDLHAPMMSLPRAFGTSLTTIPSKTPYLSADADAIEAWGQRLSAIAGQGPKIGLLWAGNPRTHSPDGAAVDRRRSIAPELLAPLFQTQGLRFFSLQKDGPAAPAAFPLIDFMGEMGDFADTAALIANLDLVIAVDTSVAHLTAAIGKPVWLLNRFDSCWRWLTGRRDSPWYPELRLYNQPQPGDWQTVVAEIAADLKSQWPDAVRRGPDE